jgi:rRNA maturation endonuclease Nob1
MTTDSVAPKLAVARNLERRTRRSRARTPDVSEIETAAALGTMSSTHRRRAHDYRCECGYQISIPQPHPTCPMCGERGWVLIQPTRQFMLCATGVESATVC